MLTRRGMLATGIVLLGLFMSWRFGARALNAIVAPLLVGLVAAALQVWRMDPPEVRRTTADYGTVGEELDVEVRLDAAKGFDATVDESVPDGVTTVGVPTGTAVADTIVSYRLGLDKRGEHRIGPTRVIARDVLGLWQTQFECGSTSDVLAFPRVRPLQGAVRASLDRLARGDPGGREFEQLREYAPGDPLQDVHWKSSAKRQPGDLLVKEYESPVESRRATVVASASERRVEEMAEAAASVANHLMNGDLAVEVVTADGDVPSGTGEGHRRAVLSLLARTAGGEVEPTRRADADVIVSDGGPDGEMAVTVGENRHAFDELVDGHGPLGSVDESVETRTAVRTDGRGGQRR